MGRKQRRGGIKDEKKVNTKAKAEPSSPNVPEEEKSVPYFPDEIFVNILSRLPRNFLSRFRYVCKQWCSMISDIFTAKYGRQMVVAISKLGEASYALRSIDPESMDVRTVCKPWKKMNPSGRLVQICGSCNGLLLIGVDDDLFLWNPLIRYCKKVLSYEPLRDRCNHIVSGLIYDSATDEYKVVMAFRMRSCTVVGSHEHIVSELCYDSATNEYKAVRTLHGCARESVAVVGSFSCKSWTSIPFPYDVLQVNPGPLVNGYLHWCTNRTTCRRRFPSLNQIIYFNPRVGIFEKVPMPKPKHVGGDVVIGLGALDRCLCMSRISNPRSENDKTVEVLAMKEYGVEQTWTIMYVISNLIGGPKGALVPLCCTKNGEALMLIGGKNLFRFYQYYSRSWHMVAYNPIDGSRKDIPIPTSTRRSYLIPTRDSEVEVVAYEESLVRPTGYDWEEEDMRGEATYVEYFPHESPRKFKRDGDGHWKFDRGI